MEKTGNLSISSRPALTCMTSGSVLTYSGLSFLICNDDIFVGVSFLFFKIHTQIWQTLNAHCSLEEAQCLFKIKDSDKFCCWETSLNLFDQSFFHFTPVNPGFQGMHVANKGKALPHFSDICVTLYIQKGLLHEAGMVAHAALTTHHLASPAETEDPLSRAVLPKTQRRTPACIVCPHLDWPLWLGDQGTSTNRHRSIRPSPEPSPAAGAKATLETQGYRGQGNVPKRRGGGKGQGRGNNLYSEFQTST